MLNGEKLFPIIKILLILKFLLNIKNCLKMKQEKFLLPLLDNSVILYTDDIIEEALNKFNLTIEISWDLIPGKSFNIVKMPENIGFLTNALNDIVCRRTISAQIILGRLFCLNKNPSELGTIGSMRTIVILGFLVKLL